MSNREYAIAETAAFQKRIQKNTTLSVLHKKIRSIVYPALRREPHSGPNIKRLKGELSEFYRYRIGDYRLFYTIEESEVIVIIVDLRSRQDSHKKR